LNGRGSVARLRNVADLVGWPRLLFLAPLWLFCRRYLAIEAPLSAPPGSTDPRAEMADRLAAAGLEVADVGPASLSALAEINPLYSVEEAERRLAEGHACKLFRRAGVPVHYRWIATRPLRLPLDGLVFLPEPTDYVSLEVCTRARHRGGGIQSATVAWSSAHAQSLGRTRKVAFVAWWNKPSLRAACRSGGFAPVGSLTQWSIGPWRRAMASGRVRLQGREVRLE
jgi:hypothetical protein